jgi:TPR repeat protein
MAQAPADPAAALAFLSSKWQGASTCGRKTSVLIDIEKAEFKDGAVVFSGKATGGDGKSLKIESTVNGRYEPTSGLVQVGAGARLPDPNDCTGGVKVLGKCVRATGILAPNPEKLQQQRAELALNSGFYLALGRDDAGAGLIGTVQGAAFDCPDFAMARSDRAPPTALAPLSMQTEQAALAYVEGLTYGGTAPATQALARVVWMERLSRRGDAINTAELGRMHETGQPPFTRNLEMAAKYYLQAAQAGESRAQRRLSRLLATGQGVTQNMAESERWSAAARATTASVGRYCVAAPMIAAYRELLEALKNDPGMRMLMIFGGGIIGMQFDEGTFRIEGAAIEGASTINGPFLCRVVGRTVGASVRNIKPEFVYAGEDGQGRAVYYDQRGGVRMNEAMASLVNAMSENVQASAAFAVKPLGGDRFLVRIVQEQVNTGNVYATQVQIGQDMLALVRSSPDSAIAPQAADTAPAPPPAPRASPGGPAKAPAGAPSARAEDPARERAVWALCQSATTAAMCRAYLQDYPRGSYAAQAQRRVAELSRGEPAMPAPAAAPASPQLAEGAVERAVDGGFLRWGQTWAVDRYIGNSVVVTERDCGADRCEARGMFKFRRFGAVLSIPFAADLVRQDAGRVAISRLCYADPSSGSQECVDF